MNFRRLLSFFILIALALMVILPFTGALTRAADTSQGRKDFLRTAIINANAFISDPAARSHKYGDMRSSPFSFYRATDYLYYSDLNNGIIAIPTLWKTQPDTRIWLSGDFHTQNLGYFDDKNGDVVFDLNDADEAYLGPFYWDLIRFSTSLYLMTHETNLNYTSGEQDTLVASFLQAYQDTLQSVNGNNDETSIEMNAAYLKSGFVQDKLQDLQENNTLVDLLNKWTVVTGGKRLFDLTNSDLATVTSDERTSILNNWNSYKQSLSSSFVASQSSSYFTIKDIARRVNSGLGSQGVDKYYVLIEGGSSSQNDDQLLEVKAETLPSLFSEGSSSVAQYNSWFTTHAQRAVTAEKALGNKVDDHLGYMSFRGESFKVQRISPYKDGFESDNFHNKSDVNDFVTYAAKALALAHARSDKDYNTIYINYNFEQAYFNAIAAWSQFKTTVDTLAKAYYQQVTADYAMFIDLLNTGQIS